MDLVGKVVGHELKKITYTDPGPPKRKESYEVMAVKMEFDSQESDKPSKALFLMEQELAKTKFEIGDPVNLKIEVRQQKLDLKGAGRGAAAKH